ncbi:MAG: DUF2723 domain-containing protein [Polyangiaceae bacterium]
MAGKDRSSRSSRKQRSTEKKPPNAATTASKRPDTAARPSPPERGAERGPRAGEAPSPVSARALAWGVSVAAFALYLATLAPTVTSEDSGELITAAAKWGVAHPPGYPLYTLLLKPFLLLPIGDIARRANIASAFFGALAAGGAALLSVELSAPRTPVSVPPAAAGSSSPDSAPPADGPSSAREAEPPLSRRRAAAAVLAGVFVAGARDVWAQCVIAEVYSLNALLLIATLFFLVRGTRRNDPRDLVFGAGVFGLSLAHHYPLMLLAAPSMAVFLLRGGRPLLRERRRLKQAGLALAAGLLVYAYLPLAARGAPPLNWGDPSSLSRFLAHVARTAYRKNELDAPISLADKVSYAGLFVRLFAAQWTAPVLAVLLPFGIHRMRDRAARRDLLLGVMAVTALGLILIPQYTYDAENIQRFDELYVPVYVCAALLLAEGIAGLAGLAERLSPALGGASWVLGAAAAAVPLGVCFSHNDLSDHRLTERYNRFILESLEPGAFYITSGDYTSFPSLYLQAVEGVRPDVILANFTGELSPAAAAYAKSLDPEAPLGDRAALQRLLVERGTRPVYVASKSDLAIQARVRPFGFVYRIQGISAPEKLPVPDVLSQPILGEHPAIPGADDLARGLVSDYLLMLGEAHAERGERGAALSRYQEAARVHAASKENVNNIASTCAERGFYPEAEALMRQAASLSPTYVTPRRNLAKLLDSLGRREDAIVAFEDLVRVAPEDKAAAGRLATLKSLPASPAPRPGPVSPPVGAPDPRIGELLRAIEKEPDNPALHNNLGNVYAESGDAQNAILAYEAAVRADPKYALAHKNLGILYREVLHDPQKAEEHFALYRSLGGK